MVAEVIINSIAKDLNRIFDYNIPKDLENKVKIGSRIFVPFGRSKALEEGFVINIKEKSEYKIKDIAGVQKDELTEENIELAKWMANRYFCNISECIKLMLPAGNKTKNTTNRTKEKTINVIYLKKEKQEILFDIENNIKSDKQKKALEFLLDNEGSTVQDVEIFTDISRAVLKTLEKNGYIEFVEKKIERNPFINKNITPTNNLELNKEQQFAFDEINESIQNNEYKQFLLYGITGSGKTEIYLQVIEKVLEKEKTAILLVPEISLTPQIVDRFIARFGEEKIAILHSKLSLGERFDQWNKIKQAKAKIVIGARSAIFAPVENLGVVIIDEEHDSSYKSEMTPRYNAKDIAEYLAKQKNVPLILGSATPDIVTYNKSVNEDIELLKLTKRANDANLPKIEVVDLKQELINGNRSMLSVSLYKSILENLNNKKQTILFLNRRGYSTFIMCRECGYTSKCKNCNISLTYHMKENRLKCHYCGYEENPVTVCPECKSTKIRYFGTGTQKLEAEIKKIFPQATTIRMDVDTVSKKNSHENILNTFKNDKIDILIGTQMIVKGHHFPNVTLVGVIAADTSMNIDDYRADERTFDLLVQVAGRAGREKEEGKVIIQTYNPESFPIECAKIQDYEKFYETEIILRKQLKYPPFCDIISLNVSGENEQTVRTTIEELYKKLKMYFENQNINILPPMPCPIDKIKNKHRWRIIIKCIFDEYIINGLNKILEDIYSNDKKTGINIDVNPTSML